MSGASLDGLYRVCVKLYSPEAEGEADADLFVPVFHEWIRQNAIPELLLFDVADYAHAPVSPGIALVTHEAHFALDRSDGRFGLLAQRRSPLDGGAADAIATTLRHAIKVADMLERDPRIQGKLEFDASSPRIEANDRLRIPNTEEGFLTFAPAVQAALAEVFPGQDTTITRIANDPRDRLAIQVKVVLEAEAAA